MTNQNTPSAGSRAAADIAALLRARNPLLWITTREEARAERLLVERGLGEEYGAALSWELCNDRAGPTYVAAGCTFEGVARIRTAPTEVIARAVLRVVDEQLSKETR